MDQLKTSFLEIQTLQPFAWLRYIDDIFFIWRHSEEKVKEFMKELNYFESSIKFTYEYSNERDF